MNPVAGWYADPASSDAVRYWDGTQWTEHTSPAPSAAPAIAPADPPAPAAPAPATAPAYGVTPAYGVQSHPTYAPTQRGYYGQPQYVVAVPAKNSKATRALVWGIVSIFINPFALPSILAIVFGAQGRSIADDMERAGVRDTGRGRATGGLVVGIVGAVLFAVWVFLYLNRN